MREWRRRNPSKAEQESKRRLAAYRALMELSYRHPDEFDELLKVEQALAGLKPTGVGFAGRPAKEIAHIDG